jgi:signal transduction histidine kinase
VRYLPDVVVVEVVDDGAGSAPSTGPTGCGYGLLGMRERVALHGGTLDAGRRPEGGFRVVARVPLSPNRDHAPDPPRPAAAASPAPGPTGAEPERPSRPDPS